MKRTPLNRKTPLKSTNSPMKRTPLKKRSKKTSDRYRKERIPFVKNLLEERPTCEICFSRPSTDVHEILTRARSGGVHGTAWLDPTNCLCLCRLCHSWVTVNVAEAEEHGWIKKSVD